MIQIQMKATITFDQSEIDILECIVAYQGVPEILHKCCTEKISLQEFKEFCGQLRSQLTAIRIQTDKARKDLFRIG